jgi:alginate O-acetyltransferase complex protein AlgI
MLGFELPENFQYPYVARSIREFWRRWHITLSTWFRDYLYIPLGGNRGGTAAVAARLFCVFLLCGLWHGASVNFVLWGLFHGLFLSLERTRFGKLLEALPSAVRHAYVLGAVSLGWVLFRAPDLASAAGYYRALAGLSGADNYGNAVVLYLSAKTLLPFAAGVLLSAPVFTFLRRENPAAAGMPARLARFALALGVFFVSASFVASETFHPFLYFQF